MAHEEGDLALSDDKVNTEQRLFCRLNAAKG
jgi:hypothetical protein